MYYVIYVYILIYKISALERHILILWKAYKEIGAGDAAQSVAAHLLTPVETLA